MDRGDDFAMLREILAHPQGTGEELDNAGGRQGSEDSGYFSKRGSKAISTVGATRGSLLAEELSEMIRGVEREDDKDTDEVAEEADDESADLDDLDEDHNENAQEESDAQGQDLNRNGKAAADQLRNEATASPTNRTLSPEHVDHISPQPRIIGARFISPRKPAEPTLSAHEAVVAGSRRLGAGR